MKPLVASKKIVNKKDIVNFKLLTFLFAFSVFMHIAATSVHAEYPLLGWLLAMLETISWICILMTWVIAIIKGIQYGGLRLWKQVWTYARTQYGRIKKAKFGDTFVSVEQLKHLRNNVQRLGLALHGLSPQNATLYAEFNSLIRFLNHCGFPHLESVRLQQKDFEFVQKWGSDLEARLQQAQRNSVYQQQAMEWMLDEACKTFERIGSKYPQAQDDAGYRRIHGALKLLKKMARNSHFPSEQMLSYCTALMEDMDGLRKQLEQTAA
jgi:hypothetical protein